MRILITGAAGFLGSHLCDRFLREGHSVVGLDNFLTGRPANIAHLTGHPRFEFVQHNISTFTYVAGQLDGILHFASPASPIDYLEHPIATLKVGALGRTMRSVLPKRRAHDFFLRPPLRCTAIRSFIRSPNRIGETSIPLGREASTTKPSVSPKR